MFTTSKSLPSDPTELRIAAEGLVELAKTQALQIEKLKHQLAGHQRHRFGSKSESADQLNLQLQLEEEETAAARTAPPEEASVPEPKQKPKRKPLPPTLPRNEQVLIPGESCKCGGDLRSLGEDVTEELEYIPGRFIVNRIVRPRMACKCCDRIVQAALPSRPIERGRPGAGLLAHVLVNKYADHCPLYRQSQIFAREGIDLDRSTLAGWLAGSGSRQNCWNHWPMLSGAMFDLGKPSLPMIPRSRCWPKRNAPPPVSGPMCAMNGLGPATPHQPHGTSSVRTEKASTPPII